MNMNNLKFSDDHEWVKIEGNTAYIGISDFAQHALGDIVFVDMPGAGTKTTAGKAIVSIESVKAVSDVLAPVSGKITKLNDELNDAPELLNQAPYDSWIFTVEMDDASELDKLMSASEYEEFCKREE